MPHHVNICVSYLIGRLNGVLKKAEVGIHLEKTGRAAIAKRRLLYIRIVINPSLNVCGNLIATPYAVGAGYYVDRSAPLAVSG